MTQTIRKYYHDFHRLSFPLNTVTVTALIVLSLVFRYFSRRLSREQLDKTLFATTVQRLLHGDRRVNLQRSLSYFGRTKKTSFNTKEPAVTAGRWRRQLQSVRQIVLSNRQVYQCAWKSASTVAIPESNEPAIAMAVGMPYGSSRLIMAATNNAATGSTITK